MPINLVIRRRADRKPGYRGPLLGYSVPGGTPGSSGPVIPPVIPPVIGLSNYVTEDGNSAYVTEDGSANYTVES